MKVSFPIKLSVILFLIINPIYLSAQHPLGIKRYYITTAQAKIIYSENLENEAFRIAQTFKTIDSADKFSLPTKTRCLPLVLNGTANITNGYFTLFPYMSLWYAGAPSDHSLGNGEWYQNLAIHEYRHVVQSGDLNRGFTKLGSFFAGAYGRSALRYSVPQWWNEGDAVYAESVLSSAGRGRVPVFDMPFAALLLDKKKYCYDKAMLGSYRNFVPGQYPLGYLLTTRARNNFGNYIWHKTVVRSSKYSFLPWAFSAAFGHFAGENLRKNYLGTMNELHKVYSERIDKTEIFDCINLTPEKSNIYTNYKCPVFESDTTILALKTSLSSPSRFVRIHKSGKIKNLNVTDAEVFDYSNGFVFYCSSVTHWRYSLLVNSDITAININNSKPYKLTKKGNYSYVSISPCGKYMVGINYINPGEYTLEVFELIFNNNKPELKKIRSYNLKENEVARTAVITNDSEIVYVSVYQNRTAIIKLNITDGISTILVSYSADSKENPALIANKLYYQSDASGVDAIWVKDTVTHQKYIACSRKYGAFQPKISQDGKILIFSDYTADGYRISSMPIKDYLHMPESEIKTKPFKYFEKQINSEPYQICDTVALTIPDKSLYKPRRYRDLYDPIKIYGWMPAISDGRYNGTLYSSNISGTLNINAGTTYYADKDYFRHSFAATYSALPVVLSIAADVNKTDDNILFYSQGKYYTLNVISNENIYAASVYLPVNLSRRAYQTNLKINIDYTLHDYSNRIAEGPVTPGNGSLSAINAGFSFSTARLSAYRDFVSRCGFSFGISYKQSINYRREAQLFNINTGIKLPGIFRQNALHINGCYSRQNTSANTASLYLFNDSYAGVRGYDLSRMQNFAKITADYYFPIAYPDCGIPGIVWIKRLRGSINGDIAKSSVLNYDFDFLSCGYKLICDFHVLRISTNIMAGFSYNRPVKSNDYDYETFSVIFGYQM